MTPAQALAEAAALIRKHGWCQLRYGGYGKPMCMMAAVYEVLDTVAGGDELEDEVVSMLRSRLSGGDDFNLEAWNDKAGRTKSEVLTVLEGAS